MPYSDPDGRGCALAILRLLAGLVLLAIGFGILLGWLITKVG